MARRIGRREGVGWGDLLGGRAALARTGRALWSSIGRESLGQARYREDCETDAPAVAWYRRRWFIHAMVVWGFLGLLAATALDYGLDILGIKETGTPVPIWYPVRLLGTAAGLMLVYGTSVMIVDRVRGASPSVARSGDGRLDPPGAAVGDRGDRLPAGARPVPARAARPGATGSSSSTWRWPWSSSSWRPS